MKFVTRAGWGARPPKSVTPLPISKVNTLVYHYSASNADEQADHANCAARVRGTQNYHMNTRGWNDIAYSWLVCKHGYVFEGRGYGARTAATGPANDFSYAVCFLGDDTANRDDVTAAGRQALIDITRAVQAKAGRKMLYRGHRDYMSTTCPGSEIYWYIRSGAFSTAVNPPTHYKVTFLDKDGKVVKVRTARWPRIAIVAVNLVKNKIRRIEIE